MIEIKQLVKKFGPFTAVDGVSFSVQRGEVLGFLGPNGAGKSTTMKMITGYLAPTSGTAVVCGHDVTAEPLAVKQRIGYLPEGAPAYPDMTPESFLNFIAGVRGLTGPQRKSRIDEIVSRVHLEGVMRQSIDTLSKGYKRRVGLAQALLHDPDVLIMDEPTDGLDPNQKHEVRTLISEMAAKKAIVLSTHILEEVDAVCTRAIVIARGRIVADGTPEMLRSKSKYHNAVTITIRTIGGAGGNTMGAARNDLQRLPQVMGVEDAWAADGHGSAGSRSGTCSFVVMPKSGANIVGEVSQLARGKGWEVDELRVEPGRLDEVFRTMTTAGPAKGGAQ
jgi:ABC-2 type transport system ATP-binding protein